MEFSQRESTISKYKESGDGSSCGIRVPKSIEPSLAVVGSREFFDLRQRYTHFRPSITSYLAAQHNFEDPQVVEDQEKQKREKRTKWMDRTEWIGSKKRLKTTIAHVTKRSNNHRTIFSFLFLLFLFFHQKQQTYWQQRSKSIVALQGLTGECRN